MVSKVISAHEDEIQNAYGFTKDEIGVHSWRKGSHTHLSCGSTAGPSGEAACLRGGHTIGGSRDVYVVQTQGSDRYCGRILAGLPVEAAEFAVSYPDFIPIDVEASLQEDGGVSEEEYVAKKAVVDAEVDLALESIFGKEILDGFPTIKPFLRVGLASHLNHREKLQAAYPANARVRYTPLFTCSAVVALKNHVRIAMPWQNHYKYFAAATGLPPHVTQFAYRKELKEEIAKIVPGVERLMDARQFNGQISLEQMQNMIQNGPIFNEMAQELRNLRQAVQNGRTSQQHREGDAGSSGDGSGTGTSRFNLFNHPDGIRRRVPPSWKFPHVALLVLYKYWHCGDEEQKISPMRDFDCTDVSFLGRRAQLNLKEVSHMMALIDAEASNNGKGPSRYMSNVDVASCFMAGRCSLDIPATTPRGRPRNIAKMMWSSASRLMLNRKRT